MIIICNIAVRRVKNALGKSSREFMRYLENAHLRSERQHYIDLRGLMTDVGSESITIIC